MKSKALHIHIDRLVVEGLGPAAQKQFVRALESQLETQMQQLAEPALSNGWQSQRISRLNAGEMRTGSTPQCAATQITSALRTAIAGKGNTRA